MKRYMTQTKWLQVQNWVQMIFVWVMLFISTVKVFSTLKWKNYLLLFKLIAVNSITFYVRINEYMYCYSVFKNEWNSRCGYGIFSHSSLIIVIMSICHFFQKISILISAEKLMNYTCNTNWHLVIHLIYNIYTGYRVIKKIIHVKPSARIYPQFSRSSCWLWCS